MNIVIARGSGFIGQKLSEYLINKGHHISILARHKTDNTNRTKQIQWLADGAQPEIDVGHIDVFINLAGVSINNGRWTKHHQQQIYESRMQATDELLRIIRQLPNLPKTLINASAIGIYPASDVERYTESSDKMADDFLAHTVLDWENKAMSIEEDGVSVACMRFGVILGDNGGAFPPMVTPYKLFSGGTFGTGKQWVSWVHIDDVIRAIEFTIETPRLAGPINVVAPFPKQMKYFGQTIGKTLNRPHWLPVSSFAMQLLLGQKSDLVLKGQFVIPEKLQKNGFIFSYSTLDQALDNLLK